MRVVIQRVKRSTVRVNKEYISNIEKGICCFIGIKNNDVIDDLIYIRDKILKLRIFEDENNNLNRSIVDIKGDILLVSQFTLYGDARKGTRPSFHNAMEKNNANILFNSFVDMFKYESSIRVETGLFGANMEVEIINDGPVTILLDSDKAF